MKRIMLVADDGYIYTDGTNYATLFFLAIGADKSKYYQITMDEYNALFPVEGDEECFI